MGMHMTRRAAHILLALAVFVVSLAVFVLTRLLMKIYSNIASIRIQYNATMVWGIEERGQREVSRTAP